MRLFFFDRAAFAALGSIALAVLAACGDPGTSADDRTGRSGIPADAAADTHRPDAASDAAAPDSNAPIDSDGDGTSDSKDCAPADATRWRMEQNLFVDADGDGHTVGGPVARCLGASLTGYSLVDDPTDCDDNDKARYAAVVAYPDKDGDGWGDGAAETLCAQGALPPGYSTAVGDCDPDDPARWQSIPYGYRDADGDGYTVTGAGTLCAGTSLPAGYPSVPNGSDCDDTDPAVFDNWTLYADVDGDGVGDDVARVMCVGQTFSGYSERSGDCAPTDAARWQSLSYAYRDKDRDTYTVTSFGTVCSGTTLPATYLNAPRDNDCDDDDPAVHVAMTVYADTDGDGVGAGTAIALCNGGDVPAGQSRLSTDCAPDDPTRWRVETYVAVDRDGDGVTAPESAMLCIGASLAPPYSKTAHGNDCNDADPSLTHWGVVYPDRDGDGVGGGQYVVMCLGASIPAGYSQYGDDENDDDPHVGPLDEEDLLEILLD